MLNKRLSLVLNLLRPCNMHVDVGTDHAQLIIEAVRCGKAKKAIGVDIVQGPVDRAIQAINRYNLNDKIDIVLSNGLEKVDVKFDALTIAGMGAPEIVRILKNGKNKISNNCSIIIQPQREFDYLREWLFENNFHILKEKLVEDKKHLYVVMSVQKSDSQQAHSYQDIVMGKNLDTTDEKLYSRYLEFILNIRINALSGLDLAEDKNRIFRGKILSKHISDLKKQIEIIKQML